MPTEAGQFSSLTPKGLKTGVMVRPTALSSERSLSSLPKLPSLPTLLRTLRSSTSGMITRPALTTKARVRSQVWISTPRRVGKRYGGSSITNGVTRPRKRVRFKMAPVITAATTPSR